MDVKRFRLNVSESKVEVLDVCKCRSNGCETKCRTVWVTGLISLILGVTSGSGWRI